MNVTEKNEGAKIPYTINGTKITFDDELTLNLAKYERDDPNHLDICRDRFGNLICGVIPGVAEIYVAEIDIPARAYIETPIEKPEAEVQSEEPDQPGGTMGGGATRDPIPFDMNQCTLTLWAV